MKQKMVFSFLVVVLVIISTFTVVAAKGEGEAKIWFRNATGAPVEFSLTDSAGNVTFLSLGMNTQQESLVPGSYTFFASASCGNISGSWNLQPNKTYVLDCENANIVAYKTRMVCADTGWYVYDTSGYWFPSWTTWGRYHWDNPYDFLYDISNGMGYINTYELGCWNGDPKYHYGW